MCNIRRTVTPSNVEYDHIYSFKNIEDFTFDNKVNRAVNESHWKKFYRLMKKGEFKPEMGLIVVDIKTGTIIDGQHRVEAFKKACEDFGYNGKLWVRFVDAPSGIEDLQNYIRQFQVSRKWSLEDYISANMYGKNDLERLKEFCLAHPFLNKGNDQADVFWRKGAAIIAKTGSAEYKNRLKQRNVRFYPDEWANAERFYNEVSDLMDAIGKSWTDGGFEYIVNAWKKVRYDIPLMEKICTLPGGIKTYFAFLRARRDIPSGQAEGVWYDFFVSVINPAVSSNFAA